MKLIKMMLGWLGIGNKTKPEDRILEAHESSGVLEALEPVPAPKPRPAAKGKGKSIVKNTKRIYRK